jgi:imidazole glycerol-phosphate synthase subunit HisF
MLKVRVIPTLLWKGVGLVKGIRFDSNRRVGAVLPAIKVYNQREVDELVLFDVQATLKGDEPDYDSIAEFGSQCFVPLTVGGAIAEVDQVRRLLRGGADKVALNTSLYKKPALVTEIAQIFGKQCVVACIDVKGTAATGWECFARSGTLATGRDPVALAKELQELGAGELVVTSIDRDGTFEGYDLELIGAVCSAVNIPVIASGGAGTCDHFVEAVRMGASAVAAASLFHFTQITPLDVKKHMEMAGIPVRIPSVS